MSIASPLLRMDGLHVSLPSRAGPITILHDVNLRLSKGRTLGIVGESGSGKSMTALSIMGLLPEGAHVEGRMELQDTDMMALNEREWQQYRGNRIAMIFQEPMTALNPAQTIGQQVAEPLRLHQGMGKRAALEQATVLLDQVGIASARERIKAYPHQFSGGQRQRIMIAMALACAPDLLIADEATTALDVMVQQQILDLLDTLVAERDMGLILISHDLAVISEYTDDVAVMVQGTVVERGETARVFAEPQHAYTQQLLESRRKLMAFATPAIPAVSAASGQAPAASLSAAPSSDAAAVNSALHTPNQSL